MEPVAAQERITVIDALRGAALFGILTANMRAFFAPAAYYFNPGDHWQGADRLVQFLIDTFVSGKFITIFATLFGVGFAIQMERAAARGQSMSFYKRRLVWLAVFGLVHALGIWWGDILLPYAICGFFLLLFRGSSQKKVWWWGMGLYWVMIVPMLAGFIAALAGHAPHGPTAPTAEKIAESLRVYASGTVADIFRMRSREWMSMNSAAPMFLPRIVALFLFGLYIWRQGYLRDVAGNIGWWRRARWVGLVVGVVCNGIVAWIDWFLHPNPMEFFKWPALVAMTLGSAGLPAFSIFYSSTVVLAFQTPWGRRLLQPFSYVGRMALSNYLLQSVICTTIFYGYGLGQFGKIGPAWGVPLTLLVYGVQVPFSAWWLARRRYGPMEWLWRKLTYGRVWGSE